MASDEFGTFNVQIIIAVGPRSKSILSTQRTCCLCVIGSGTWVLEIWSPIQFNLFSKLFTSNITKVE